MNFIYNIGIQLTNVLLKCIAPFNTKINHGVEGRTQTFNILEQHIDKSDKTIWFHCASLGEYEQGLPVFTEIRSLYKDYKFVLTFFSPSGYLIKKDNSIADIVVYLPIDTKKNAKRFVEIVQPELTVFVKYDIWPNVLSELKKRQKKIILISALFRENQSYFKFYGKILRRALLNFDHIFTQNESSKLLLYKIGCQSVTVVGDTRFDRVFNQLQEDNTLNFIESFKGNSLCIVAGSTWPEGEDYISNYINNNTLKHVKFIIAPHNINSGRIEKLKSKLIKKTVLFSEKDNVDIKNAQVLIINTIGLLSKIYSYADLAYVGGAIGTTGLHNTLEPAVFGIPIIIGNNYKRFPEAKNMIDKKGMYAIKNKNEFKTVLDKLIHNPKERQNSGKSNYNYIEKNKGAVVQIVSFLRK